MGIRDLCPMSYPPLITVPEIPQMISLHRGTESYWFERSNALVSGTANGIIEQSGSAMGTAGSSKGLTRRVIIRIMQMPVIVPPYILHWPHNIPNVTAHGQLQGFLTRSRHFPLLVVDGFCNRCFQ